MKTSGNACILLLNKKTVIASATIATTVENEINKKNLINQNRILFESLKIILFLRSKDLI